MSKIKEKNSSAKLRSAEKAKDRKFEQWVQQQFMAEAAAIEKEIDEIPDSEEFEPTEEKFQKLLQRAKEQGSVHSEPESGKGPPIPVPVHFPECRTGRKWSPRRIG